MGTPHLQVFAFICAHTRLLRKMICLVYISLRNQRLDVESDQNKRERESEREQKDEQEREKREVMLRHTV